MTDPIQQAIRNLRLAQDLIDAGYKGLAMELHPDKGGTAEQMVTLNKARERLARAVASPGFFAGFEAKVERRKRHEKTPELSELRELKACLKRACWNDLDFFGVAIYIREPCSPLQNQLPANKGESRAAEVAPRLAPEVTSR
jgi:hypothetical protein